MSMFIWRTQEKRRTCEKGCRYDDVALLPKELGNGVFLVGSDRTLKELDGEKFGTGSCREFEISSSNSALSAAALTVASDVFNQSGSDGENDVSTSRRKRRR